MKIKIAGKFYDFFNDISIDTNLDSVASTFAFTATFDPTNKAHKEIFRPLSYHKVEFIGDDGKPISTGTILNHTLVSTASPEVVSFSGYSLGGLLEDIEIPYALYPLQSDNRSLKQIAKRLLDYFKINMIIYDSVKKDCDQVIKKSVASAEESIKEYLSKIAAQKNVVMSHDVYGNVIFFRPDVKAKSKAFFDKTNAIDMNLDVQGQGMHSLITTLRQPSKKKKSAGIFDDEESSSDSTLTPVDHVKNILVQANRPKLVILTSGSDTDTLKGAKNTLACELKNIVLSFSLEKWERLSIGDIIEIQNDELFLFNKTRFMICSTVLNENSDGRTLDIKCVLPETFTGDAPKNIFS